jgi:hypothetical protein
LVSSGWEQSHPLLELPLEEPYTANKRPVFSRPTLKGQDPI